MAHIALDPNLPGILGPLALRPQTAGPLLALADALLHQDSPLSRAEREQIAASVSAANACTFCHASHQAVADRHVAAGEPLDDGPRMRTLLALADQVRVGGGEVTAECVASARAAGASDLEIHDTVLIAAAFCMFNRYVDGLGTALPDDEAAYAEMATTLAVEGYRRPEGSS